jgi:GDP-L-fucose synthase
MQSGASSLRFNHVLGSYSIVTTKIPELSVGYDEDSVWRVYEASGRFSGGDPLRRLVWADAVVVGGRRSRRPGRPPRDETLTAENAHALAASERGAFKRRRQSGKLTVRGRTRASSLMEIRGARIIVTGGGGFLGRHVVARLEAKGATCVVPRSTEYDLTTEEAVGRLFSEHEAEAVVHLAARVGGIGANRAHPALFVHANLMMGLLVMEYARRAGVEKYLQVGTVCSYPKFTPVPFREEALWDGYPEETNAPYGIAKRALLVQAQAYRSEFGMNAVTLIPVNLYGPYDDFDLETSHVIPALIRKMIEGAGTPGQSIELWGDGSPTREFLYVADCAEGVVLAAMRYDGSEPVNLGTGEEISIRDLAGAIADETGYDGEIVWDTTKPNGQPRRKLDTSRARELFGFEARTGFREGIARTVAWYREHAAAYAAR